MMTDIFQQHFTLSELARKWHMSPTTLRAWFINEPGVIKYGSAKLKKGRQRTHLSLRVPLSVALRVYRARTGLQPANGN